MDLSKVAFDSRLNYLKKDTDISGSTNISLGGSGANTTHTVTHNLGYIPFITVGANLNNTTDIWSNNRVNELTDSSGGGDQPVRLAYWYNDTELEIQITNGTGALQQSGLRTIYWNIYRDYEA
jgi:hypothetical protein